MPALYCNLTAREKELGAFKWLGFGLFMGLPVLYYFIKFAEGNKSYRLPVRFVFLIITLNVLWAYSVVLELLS